MIEYIRIDKNQIQRIKPLWSNLINYLYDKSKNFKNEFQNKVFENRFESFLNNKEEDCLIVVVVDTDRETDIGYIAAHIFEDSGEIDSLYVNEEIQSKGIGKTLMDKALDFFSSKGIKNQFLYVSEGNEEVINFYVKFGFVIRKYYLVRK